MSRVSPVEKVSAKDIMSLNSIVSNELSDPALVRRVQVVLEYAKGNMTNKQIAVKLNMRPNSVIFWRNRFLESGIDGLMDKKKPGRRGADKRPLPELVQEKLKESPPSGEESWTANQLAEILGTGVDAVRRALRSLGVTLSRPRSWKVASSLEAGPRTFDLCGMYLSPEASAVVLTIYSGGMPPQPSEGDILTRSSGLRDALERSRNDNGSLPLFGALEIAGAMPAEDKVHARFLGIQDFLDSLTASLPQDSNVHYQVLVFSPHGLAALRPRMQRANIYVAAAPSLDGWLDQVKDWIGMLGGRDSGMSEALDKGIRSFLKDRIGNCEPFMWRRRGPDDDGRPQLPPLSVGAFVDPEVDNVTEICARVVFRSGEVVERTFTAPNLMPSIDGMDCSSPAGVVSYADKVEGGLLTAREQVFKGVITDFLNEAVKKNSQKTARTTNTAN